MTSSWEPQEIIELGDQILVRVRLEGEGKTTSLAMEQLNPDRDMGHLWTLRYGRALRPQDATGRGARLAPPQACRADEAMALHQAKVMGVVNVTPDRFSDGGGFLDPDASDRAGPQTNRRGRGHSRHRRKVHSARARRRWLRRRRSARVSRWSARSPRAAGSAISVDTRSTVAQAAIAAGGTMFNDVSALRADPDLAGLCAERGCEVVLMHMLGDPRTMRSTPTTRTSSMRSRRS